MNLELRQANPKMKFKQTYPSEFFHGFNFSSSEEGKLKNQN